MRQRSFSLLLAVCSAWSGFVQGAEEKLGEVGEIPVGKLAFVTGKAFGSDGAIRVIGNEISPVEGGSPSFTADGNTLIYTRNEPDGTVLHLHDLLGNTISQVKVQADAENPVISPDGAKLAYVLWTAGRKSSHIWVCNINGTGAWRLTFGEHYDWSPKWSPDGSKIAFESTRDGERQIYLMNADGSEQRSVTNDATLCHAPVWSPDGTQLAFMCRASKEGTADIYTIRADGTDKKAVLSDLVMRDSEPAWSPDGKWLVFTRSLNKTGEEAMDLWIMRTDGGELRQLTHNANGVCSYEPVWAK